MDLYGLEWVIFRRGKPLNIAGDIKVTEGLQPIFCLLEYNYCVISFSPST